MVKIQLKYNINLFSFAVDITVPFNLFSNVVSSGMGCPAISECYIIVFCLLYCILLHS